MSITFVAAASSQQSSPAPAVPTGTANGDVMLAFVSTSRQNDTMNTTPAGWTLLDTNPSNAVGTIMTYYRVASSEPASYTWVWQTGGTDRATIATWRGVDNVSPINAHSTPTADGSSVTDHSAPTLTTSVINTMVVAYFVRQSATTVTSWAAGTFPAAATVESSVVSPAGYAVEDAVWSSSGSTGALHITSGASCQLLMASIALAPSVAVLSVDRHLPRGTERGVTRGVT